MRVMIIPIILVLCLFHGAFAEGTSEKNITVEQCVDDCMGELNFDRGCPLIPRGAQATDACSEEKYNEKIQGDELR
jgi:hypothetical protein